MLFLKFSTLLDDNDVIYKCDTKTSEAEISTSLQSTGADAVRVVWTNAKVFVGNSYVINLAEVLFWLYDHTVILAHLL